MCTMATTALPDFDSQWNFGDPKASEEAFRKILAEHDDAPQAYRLELRTQVARALGLQRRFDEALAVLDEVEAELDVLERDEHRTPKVRYLLERGRVFNSSGEPGKARPLFDAAYELADQASEDRLAVDALHMVAIVCEGDEALEWNLEALAYAEESEQPGARKWLGSLYNNIGWSYHDLGQYERALEVFEKGLAWRMEQGQPVPTRIARWTVGRALRSLERLDEALEAQQAIRADFPDAELPYVEEELGECLLTLGRAEEAAPHFQTAWAGLKDDAWLAENEPERMARLEKLAEQGVSTSD
jgi:tetratricopeptide (TPR) repeat protein